MRLAQSKCSLTAVVITAHPILKLNHYHLQIPALRPFLPITDLEVLSIPGDNCRTFLFFLVSGSNSRIRACQAGACATELNPWP